MEVRSRIFINIKVFGDKTMDKCVTGLGHRYRMCQLLMVVDDKIIDLSLRLS